MSCSCGNTDQHVIARRQTADGYEVNLWENGAITGAMGIGFRSVPLSRPKTQEAVDRALTLGHLLMGDVELYDATDLPALHTAAKRAAARDGLPGTMRRLFTEQASARQQLVIPLSWRPINTNNRGEVTERWARLPALRWPGLVVWDFCGSAGSSGGRYQVFHRIHTHGKDETVVSTGLRFRSLRDLFDHLDTY